MRKENDKEKETKLVAPIILVVGLVVLVLLFFLVLNHVQENKIRESKTESSKESTINIREKSVDVEDSTSEETTEESGKLQMQHDDVYLIRGNEKKSNIFERVERLSYSSDVRYTNQDLSHLDANGLLITRCEIFARHGSMFNNQDIQAYFDSQAWYVAQTAPDEFDDDVLNDVERYNVRLIQNYEMKKGY